MSRTTTYENLINIVAKAPGHFYWKDTKGVYQGSNDAQAIFLGYKSGKDLIGKTDFDLPWKEQAGYLQQIDRQVMETQEEYSVEEVVNCNKGLKAIFFSRKIPLYDPKTKKVIGIIGSSLDITGSKKAEIAKQEFLMNMSHDLRTPLAGIIGLSSLQIDEATSAQEKKYGEWIHSAGEQLLGLLNSVIEVTATEQQIENIKKENINLSQFAEELLALMQPAVAAKELDFQIKLDKHLPLVISDRIKLKRIILNLLSNALKFTKQGTITLKINVLTMKNDKAAIKISVIDTGIGISKDKLEKIFDRFYRVHPSYLAEYTGYGLGLYLVKKATESLGGKIKVSSEEDKGSCFSVEFNFTVVEPDSNALLSIYSEPIMEPQPITDKQKGSVLVAEDNTLVLYVVKKMLSSLGYQAITESTGETALQALKTQVFDWVLLDIGLPDLSGIEVARHYRQWEQENNKSHLPIFALTAHAEKQVKQQCKDVGFDYVLQKPFTDKDFKTIEKFLK